MIRLPRPAAWGQLRFGGRLGWARGAVGGTIFTFKQYSIAYVELLHRMATQGGPEGKRAALLALALGSHRSAK